MIIGRVLHQQILQLKWHVLACVAVIMVLPLEEAAVNLHAGDGFFSSSLAGAALLLAPLLAGLIACANVQADMDDKRYLFWRSKPVSIAAIVPLKYGAGLILALLIVLCPILFSVASVKLNAGHRADALDTDYMRAMLVISCLAYSVCFLTNVLVRKTARAWLIGMALTCFVLLAPFILPLGILDIVSDMAFLRASRAYLSITLLMALVAFILALLAVKHDWHLRTSLKGLLWAGAGLIFGLTLLFSGQIANIRILDEQTIDKSGPGYYFGGRLEQQGDKTVVPSQMGAQGGHQITIDGHKISLEQIKEIPTESTGAQLQAMAPRFTVADGLLSKQYYKKGVYQTIGSELYFVSICPYYIEEEVTDRYGEPKKKRYWKKLYLRSFRVAQGLRIPQSSLDLSDCIVENRPIDSAIRQVKDNLMAIVAYRHCMTVEISDQGDLELIEKKPMKSYSRFLVERTRPFKLPMIPLDSLDITDRIKLTLDINYIRHRNFHNGLHHSLVHIHQDQISFALVSKKDVARYDVINWDQENIYCQFRDARTFAFLEQRSDIWQYSPCFVQNGNLYAYDWRTLMVFDISSNRGIRKLGHFERISTRFAIDDIKVEEDGRILMLAETNASNSQGYAHKWRVYLLENPQ